jgi:hypothetical protein
MTDTYKDMIASAILNAGTNGDGDDRSLSAVERMQSRIITTREVKALPPVEWLVQGVLPVGSLAILYGPSGVGKSFASIDLACSIATGLPFLDSAATRPCPVLYVVGEGLAGTGARIESWEQHRGVTVEHVHWHKGAVNVFDPLQVEALALTVTRLGVGLVLLDTWARCTVGMDENSTRDTMLVVDAMDRLRDETGVTVGAIHHAGKDVSKGARGSSALKGAADTEVEMPDPHTLRVTKQKDGLDGLVIGVKRTVVGASCVLEPVAPVRIDEGAAMLATLDVLRQLDVEGAGVPSGRWRLAAGLPDRTFFRHLAELRSRGFISSSGGQRPRYSVEHHEEDPK